MSRLPGALAAACALGAAATALAYVRTTTVDNDPAHGIPIFWKTPKVTYVLNASGYASMPGCASAANAAALARVSFSTWNGATRAGESQPCTRFEFVDGGDTTATDLGYDRLNSGSNHNLVVFRRGLCSDVSDPICRSPAGGDLGPCIQARNCWSHDSNTGSGGILALTTVTFNPSSGEILDADMELNGWNGSLTPSATGFYFTCAPPGSPVCPDPSGYGASGCIGFDIGNTVTHEAGHVLGLDHVCVRSYPPPYNVCPTDKSQAGSQEPTMAPSASLGDTDKRSLQSDDVEGVCSIYPATSSGGCAAGGGGGVLTLLALGLARWRGRARRG